MLFVCFLFCTVSLSAEEISPFRVGVLYWSMNIPGQVAMRAGLEARAEQLNENASASESRGLDLIWRVAGDGEEGILNQIRQMNELIDLKVDLLIVQPTDNVALSEALQRANQANIPVVTYDQYISSGKLAAYRTSDNYQAGWLNGEFIASLYAASRIVRLILVDYPHVSSTVERLNGFLDALSKAGVNYQILQTYQAVEPISGKLVATRILNDFPQPGSVDVVFTVNDGGGVIIAEELFKAGRTEILHATIDGDPKSVNNIKEGRITVIDSAQFCGPLGEEAIQASYDILCGKKVPYHALIPVFPITRETLSQYPGWAGPIPKTITKSWESLNGEWSGNLSVVKE
ncbi:MAG: sugar ABC transporter substrate-binding protein [Candidatus Riflebacteria bacterium]|nr:sugar ABC transporter substrate-binding protein [Candidatus Riflebacteria bacterium]